MRLSEQARVRLILATTGALALLVVLGTYLLVPGLRQHATAHADGITGDGVCGDTPSVQFTDADGQPILWLEVASTEAEREQGLMNRTYVDPDAGMVFLFAPPTHVGFWMHDTPLSLSIAFISADGTVVDVQDMQAETDTVHYASDFYSYAVEANLGWFANNGVAPGQHASFCLPPVTPDPG